MTADSWSSQFLHQVELVHEKALATAQQLSVIQSHKKVG